jgi:uncharacterized protein (DUF488 family)
MNKLYTIGHSTHSVERFIELLKMHGITALCDVRSSPYSRYNPQFNRENLQRALKAEGVIYVFLGEELGPRSEDPSCYVGGKVRYDRLAKTQIFKRGLERLFAGMKSYRVAMMCAEKDPITCHRMILICKALRSESVEISHILEDGTTESLSESELRLLHALKMPQLRLFEKVEDLILRAYDTQSNNIAYVREDKTYEASEGEEQE